MKRNQRTYNVTQLASAIFMILALLWLTISAPFVNAIEQELAKQDKTSNVIVPIGGNEEESPNPLGNTTEEKTSKSGNPFSEEYLHDHHSDHHLISIISQYHNPGNAGTYVAFHGEVQVPPPNVA